MMKRYLMSKRNRAAKTIPQSISLISKSEEYNILSYIPRFFSITTNDSSGQFSTLLLVNTSGTISEFLKKNPNNLKYHLDIDDKNKLLEKFEKIYQGESVNIEKNEIVDFRRIKKELKLENFPDVYEINFNRNVSVTSPSIQFISKGPMIKINESTLANYDKIITIRTKKSEYKCNFLGVLSSTVIRDIYTKDQMIDHYSYDFEDEGEEFKFIQDIFNFKTVSLTNNNAEIIREIAVELGIECILSVLDSYINDNEKMSQVIDDQLNIVDSIDDVFDLLYNIKEKTVKTVSILIKDSKWSKTEENIYELAAFILQVIRTSIQLHEYLIELLLSLNENDEKSNKLSLLFPFLTKRLLFLFNEKINKTNDDLIFPFVYQLYKRELIPKDKIENSLKNCSFDNHFLVSWFFPELIELNTNKYQIEIIKNSIFDKSINETTKSNINIGRLTTFKTNRITNSNDYFPIVNNIEEYKQIRDNGGFDNELKTALKNDNVDAFQSIVSKNVDILLKETFKQNMFEPFFKKSIRYLNYAAAYGSIKCFKYMLLNNESIDESTFEMAVIGGNVELIRIVDNEKNEESSSLYVFKSDNKKKNEIQRPILKVLQQTIQRHQNDIFDWIFNQKLDQIKSKKDFITLMICSLKNGNLHTFIQLIDNGFNFDDDLDLVKNSTKMDSLKNDYCDKYSKYLEAASENGFYSLLIFLIDLINKGNDLKNLINPKYTVIFGNIYIFKLFEKKMNERELQSTLNSAVSFGLMNIIIYFFDTIINRRLQINSENSIEILSNGFNKNIDEVLDYLIDKINEICPFNEMTFCELLRKANTTTNIKKFQKIGELIYKNNPTNDFTQLAIEAVKMNKVHIIKFLTESNYRIDYVEVSESIFDKVSITAELLSLIMNKLNQEDRKRMIDLVDKSPLKKDKSLIEYLLKEKASLDYALIDAVIENNLELIDIILKNESSPSFINKDSDKGTALYIAVINNNAKIVKKLLSIPGINPNIIYCKLNTPLIMAASKLRSDIFNLIFDFYGDRIKEQKWQLEKALRMIIFDPVKPDEKRKFIEISLNQSKELLSEKSQQVIQRIINTNCIDPNLRVLNDTLLTYLIKNFCNNIVISLLQYEKIDINLGIPETGDTPLMIAIRNKNIEIAEILLLNPKIDVNLKNYEKETALITALKLKNEEIAEFILNNNNFIPEQNNISYAFCLSGAKTSKKIVSLNCFDVNYVHTFVDKKSKYKEISTLKKATMLNDIDIFDSIINNPSFIKIESQIIDTIHIAIQNNQIEFLKKLLLMIEEFNHDVNSNIFNGDSLLIESIKENSKKDTISCILENHNFNSKKSDIVKAFILIFTNIALKTINFVFDRLVLLDLLYNYDKEHEHLIDLYKEDNEGTSLLSSIYSSLFASIKANPNSQLLNEFYPLEVAIIENYHIFALSLISSNQIEVNFKFEPIYLNDSEALFLCKNTTYLHLAAEFGRSEMIKPILDYHLYDINVLNSLGETAMMEAVKHNKPECVKVFFEMKDLDFLHKRNNGDDALKMVRRILCYRKDKDEEKEIKNKEEYLSKLLDLMSHIKQSKKFYKPKFNVGYKSQSTEYSKLRCYSLGIAKFINLDYIKSKKNQEGIQKKKSSSGFKFSPKEKTPKDKDYLDSKFNGYKFQPFINKSANEIKPTASSDSKKENNSFVSFSKSYTLYNKVDKTKKDDKTKSSTDDKTKPFKGEKKFSSEIKSDEKQSLSDSKDDVQSNEMNNSDNKKERYIDYSKLFLFSFKNKESTKQKDSKKSVDDDQKKSNKPQIQSSNDNDQIKSSTKDKQISFKISNSSNKQIPKNKNNSTQSSSTSFKPQIQFGKKSDSNESDKQKQSTECKQMSFKFANSSNKKTTTNENNSISPASIKPNIQFGKKKLANEKDKSKASTDVKTSTNKQTTNVINSTSNASSYSKLQIQFVKKNDEAESNKAEIIEKDDQASTKSKFALITQDQEDEKKQKTDETDSSSSSKNKNLFNKQNLTNETNKVDPFVTQVEKDDSKENLLIRFENDLTTKPIQQESNFSFNQMDSKFSSTFTQTSESMLHEKLIDKSIQITPKTVFNLYNESFSEEPIQNFNH